MQGDTLARYGTSTSFPAQSSGFRDVATGRPRRAQTCREKEQMPPFERRDPVDKTTSFTNFVLVLVQRSGCQVAKEPSSQGLRLKRRLPLQ